MMNNHVTQLTIDLNAVDFNLNFFKEKIAPNTRVLAVVKAFGYGSEATLIAKHLSNKVDYFAVAYTEEGIALRGAGIRTPILVLHPQISNLERLIEHQLEPNLYNIRILNSFVRIAQYKKLEEYPIHLKFNTGLNRLGFLATDMDAIADELKSNSHLVVASIFSHLVASEDVNEHQFTLDQIAQFKAIKKSFELQFGYTPLVHMTNTSGVLNYPEAHFSMVRIGIGLLGFANAKSITNQLKNVSSLRSIISQIHTIKKGDSVGYNRGFKAKHMITAATIPIGHADGIYRSLGHHKGWVSINDQRAYIIGNVCMDMIMVDISEIECTEGDEVVIFKDQETVEELAAKANTISYELLTAISQRIARITIP